MKNICKIAIGLGLGLVAAGCSSDWATPYDQRADAAGEVCREVRMGGSNVMRKECMTPAAWEAYDEAERDGAQDFLRRADTASSITGGNNGGGPVDVPF